MGPGMGYAYMDQASDNESDHGSSIESYDSYSSIDSHPHELYEDMDDIGERQDQHCLTLALLQNRNFRNQVSLPPTPNRCKWIRAIFCARRIARWWPGAKSRRQIQVQNGWKRWIQVVVMLCEHFSSSTYIKSFDSSTWHL